MQRILPVLWSLIILCSFSLTSCASSDEVLVNKEPGFHYGYALDKTEVAATKAALRDLAFNIFTDTKSIPLAKKIQFTFHPEMQAAFDAIGIKPQLSEKKNDSDFRVIYRISYEDWNRAEAKRLEKLRLELGTAYKSMLENKSDVMKQVSAAADLLGRIERNGVSQKLLGPLPSTELLATLTTTWTKDQLSGLVFVVSPQGGLVKAGMAITVQVRNSSGKALPGFDIQTLWSAGGKDLPSIVTTTDAEGKIVVAYPNPVPFPDQKNTLIIGTALIKSKPDIALLATIDNLTRKSFAYSHSTNLESFKLDDVKVAGGTFNNGKVPQDRKAGGIEKNRKVDVAEFYMDRNLVSNADYKAYLLANNVPRATWPEYLESASFNAPNQPVIGVSYDDAVKYAAWISSISGTVKRLPTEEEFEVAARAGAVVIFPWGDQLPSDGVRANYAGNGKFESTSPIDSFPNGKNPLGLNDMAGNVWQWTASKPNGSMSGEQSHNIVKGGSYIDGQNELRISNRQLRNPAIGHPDTGFRLVRN